MRKVFVLLLSSIFVFNLLCVSGFCGDVVKEEDEITLPTAFIASAENKEILGKLPVEIKSKAAVLMDVETGEILMEYNPDLKLYPASVTKIMTILLVAEAINSKKITLADKVSCSENAASKGGSQIWLEAGEQMTVDELLRATVIGSANDAATLLGEYISGSEESFIDLMNTRAKELGMSNTVFVNATGLDDTTDEHLTTARDIAIMSRELLKYDFITDYTTVWIDSLRNGATELVNTNKLVRFYDGTTGLKTGTTAKAGCCVSASAKRDNLHLVAVVMGSANSTDRFETAKKMLNWGFSNYFLYTPKIDENLIKNVTVLKGINDSVGVNVPRILPILIKKGDSENVKVQVELCENIEAPVIKGQTLGSAAVYVNDNKVNEYKLLAEKDIKKLNLFSSMLKVFNFISTGEECYPFEM